MVLVFGPISFNKNYIINKDNKYIDINIIWQHKD